MESVQALSSIVGATRVQERNAGRRGDPEAFRRAMQDHAGEQAAAGGETPVRTELQRPAANGRRSDGATSHHVDVVA